MYSKSFFTELLVHVTPIFRNKYTVTTILLKISTCESDRNIKLKHDA